MNIITKLNKNRIEKTTPKSLINIFFIVFGTVFITLILMYYSFHQISFYSMWLAVILFLSIVLTAQGIFSLFLLLYAWDNPNKIRKFKSPEKFAKPEYSFTAMLPARHEEKVIGYTIESVANIDYPEELKEVLVICRSDDPGTIEQAQKTIDKLGKDNIRVVIFNDLPINKPHGLNYALPQAKGDVIVIFDAEDDPHKEIYQVVNTVMVKKGADVVQSGVQLMNFMSNWFSTFNVLEYFFWFKSSLQFFANKGLVPLGGNTVFMKKHFLEKVNGWDENCLTEDADIGIRLSKAGAKIRIVYDEKHATREETPPTVPSFIKQRTRWIQGFIQILEKGEWKTLPKVHQRLLALYILGWPIVQALLLFYIPLSLSMMFLVKIPLLIAMVSMLPFYILVLQLIVYNIGLYEFTKSYEQKYPLTMPFRIFLTFFPYQFILSLSSFRAIIRFFKNNKTWEKTEHNNAHRNIEEPIPNLLLKSSNN